MAADHLALERFPEVLRIVRSQPLFREGWRYGPQRDDVRREHPGLLPYEQLSESEKAFDRNTAMETVRVILALGFRVVPPSASGR